MNYPFKWITNGTCLYLFECGNNICILLQDLSGYLYWVELVQGLQTLLNVLRIERKQKTHNDTRGFTHHVIFTQTASAIYRLNSTAFWKVRGHVWFIKHHWIIWTGLNQPIQWIGILGEYSLLVWILNFAVTLIVGMGHDFRIFYLIIEYRLGCAIIF